MGRSQAWANSPESRTGCPVRSLWRPWAQPCGPCLLSSGENRVQLLPKNFNAGNEVWMLRATIRVLTDGLADDLSHSAVLHFRDCNKPVQQISLDSDRQVP